jgi:hypothetical protein
LRFAERLNPDIPVSEKLGCIGCKKDFPKHGFLDQPLFHSCPGIKLDIDRRKAAFKFSAMEN